MALGDAVERQSGRTPKRRRRRRRGRTWLIAGVTVIVLIVGVLGGGYRTIDIAGPGGRTVAGSVFTEMLREEMQRTLEHAERYGWGV